ncbi:MAG: methylmalonyl-CoA mutase small subunit [Draconibacterium sp.]|nr:MAG: methylmalonyl-CoA mutase small subunit [Draconibacterium sp.]
MDTKKQKLFTDFEPVSTKQWEEKINGDLKGKDYARALLWKTYEGITVKPYYRSADLESLGYLDVAPGEFPYVRGTKIGNDWNVRQDIFVLNNEEANKKALNVLSKGVSALGFYFDCCRKITEKDLEVLLKDIFLEAAEINFVCRCENCNCIKAFVDFVETHYKSKKTLVSGSSAIDPLIEMTLKGKLEKNAFAGLKTAIEQTRELPAFRVIGIHGKFYANSGASIVQELAFSLAQGAEYLTHLTELGESTEEIAQNIKFNFGISNNYFMEIAKLRAARLLWAQIVMAYKVENKDAAKMIIHSETNTYNKTIYDPYVNMLRTQTEAMSAILGGADSITITPFDAVYETPTEFSERIARNQQILLKEEAHLDKVSDPAGGAYYIESLTSSLIDHAWELFLEVQEKGGFMAALREGFIQHEIKEMAAQREKKLAQRRENLLGTNQFPNFSEQLTEELDASLFQPMDLTGENAEIETLKPVRGAQSFEKLRYKTDRFAKEHKRPVAFMLTIGQLVFRKARAQFSCNFFAVAGFEVIDNNGFQSAEEGVNAAKEKNADIIVVCSSDEEYAEIVPKVAELLNNEILVVAGNPECREELKEKGITNFIHVRSNILEELKAYQDKLGI